MEKKINVSKILLRNGDSEFLIVKEKSSGKWELPGGKIRGEEDRFDAAKRELEEETGLEVGDFEDVVRIEVESSSTVNCYILFAELEKVSPVLDQEELSDYRWMTPEEYREADWHADGGYGAPAMTYVKDYLNEEKLYSENNDKEEGVLQNAAV